MDFFDKANIGNIRLRSFYEQITENKKIFSEGAFQIVFQNNGEEVVNLKDSSGQSWTLAPGFPFDFNSHILTGHPGIVRDDIIDIEFVDTGLVKSLQVRFDRFVKKGDTQTYPGQ